MTSLLRGWLSTFTGAVDFPGKPGKQLNNVGVQAQTRIVSVPAARRYFPICLALALSQGMRRT